LQGFYLPDFPVGSVIYPATVGKVTPEDRYSFPTGSVKVHPKGRYSFPTGSVIGRRRRTARTFLETLLSGGICPTNGAIARHAAAGRGAHLSPEDRHSFPTGSVFGACWCLPGQFLLVVACPLSPQARYSRGRKRSNGDPADMELYMAQDNVSEYWGSDVAHTNVYQAFYRPPMALHFLPIFTRDYACLTPRNGEDVVCRWTWEYCGLSLRASGVPSLVARLSPSVCC
jgi:hypothetical protein